MDPTYGRAKAGRPARTYIQQLCEDTGCSPKDPPEAMNDREKWWERVRDIRAGSKTWWWIVVSKEGHTDSLLALDKPHHNRFPWKNCICKQCFLLSTFGKIQLIYWMILWKPNEHHSELIPWLYQGVVCVCGGCFSSLQLCLCLSPHRFFVSPSLINPSVLSLYGQNLDIF